MPKPTKPDKGKIKASDGPAPASAAGRPGFELPALLLGDAFALVTLLQYLHCHTWLVLLCCLASLLLCAYALGVKVPKEGLPAAAAVLLLFFLWMAASLLWAGAGKLFLREFSKRLYILPLALFICLGLPRREEAVRRLLLVLSAAGAIYALLSVDMASLRLSRDLLSLFPGFAPDDVGFEAGTRLTGIFGNANISAGLLGICIFFSVYLLESARAPLQRGFAAAYAALQAYTFLLNFSLGATGFFLLGVIVYLVCAGKRRVQVLLRMAEIALPAAAAVFLSFRAFEGGGGPSALPLSAALLGAAAAVLLELLVFPSLSRRCFGKGKGGLPAAAAVPLLFVLYAAAALLLRSGVTLGAGETLRRACYPAPGSWQLVTEGEGDLNVTVVSQDRRETVMHTETVLYTGNAREAAFTVPDGSLVVYLRFSAPRGARLDAAWLTGSGASLSLHLGYPLLPGFISNRLQGLRANENAIQRAAFFRDGIRIFRDHPILGAGLGGFESLLYGYQDFRYETRYVHNHYIQVLLDCGIVGFLLYAALLVLTLGALWRGRRPSLPFRALHPALCAAFCMLVLHSGMEVVMSTAVYLPYALTVLALSAVCFGKPAIKAGPARGCTAAAGAAALVYAVLIVLNMAADTAVRRSTGSNSAFFRALETAQSMDVFERNDWRVSYVAACADTGSLTRRATADRYAAELMDVPSNSLHKYLVHYYLTFREYDLALEAARKGTAFNRADSAAWNACFEAYAAAWKRCPEDGPEILAGVRALQEDLERAQEALLDSIVLSDASGEIIRRALNG